MKVKTKKLILFSVMTALVFLFYYTGAYHNFTLSNIQKNLDLIRRLYKTTPASMISMYLLLFVGMISLSIPGTLVLTFLAGAVFGLYWGTFIVTVASTIGATIAFLLSRYLFRESVMHRFNKQFQKLNCKFQRNGKSYLFVMRVIPVGPFVVINSLMGLTPMKAWSYIWITFVAMVPGNFVHVFIGREISEIHSARDLLTWPIILILTVIGISPFIFKWFVHSFESK